MVAAAGTPEPSEKDKRIMAATTRSSRLGIYAIIGGQHLFNYLSRFVSSSCRCRCCWAGPPLSSPAVLHADHSRSAPAAHYSSP